MHININVYITRSVAKVHFKCHLHLLATFSKSDLPVLRGLVSKVKRCNVGSACKSRWNTSFLERIHWSHSSHLTTFNPHLRRMSFLKKLKLVKFWSPRFFWTKRMQLIFRNQGFLHIESSHLVRSHHDSQRLGLPGHDFIQLGPRTCRYSAFWESFGNDGFLSQNKLPANRKSNGQMSNTCRAHDKPWQLTSSIGTFRL